LPQFCLSIGPKMIAFGYWRGTSLLHLRNTPAHQNRRAQRTPAVMRGLEARRPLIGNLFCWRFQVCKSWDSLIFTPCFLGLATRGSLRGRHEQVWRVWSLTHGSAQATKKPICIHHPLSFTNPSMLSQGHLLFQSTVGVLWCFVSHHQPRFYRVAPNLPRR
jgi:hypothetical protein